MHKLHWLWTGEAQPLPWQKDHSHVDALQPLQAVHSCFREPLAAGQPSLLIGKPSRYEHTWSLCRDADAGLTGAAGEQHYLEQQLLSSTGAVPEVFPGHAAALSQLGISHWAVPEVFPGHAAALTQLGVSH